MIRIKDLSIQVAGFSLDDINLNILDGEFFALMGPTGAGKTLLLEAIAGLIKPRRGKIEIDGKDVTYLPPEKRKIGIVYQDYALFPHLTVLENIRYGLHFHKIKKDEEKKRLNYLADQLKIRPILERYPENLSGGEKQRVALARALIINPKLLLLDEPLSALDPVFREEMKKELKEVHKSHKITFLMVSHDFSDVLSLAGKGAIMNQGRIEQIGDISEIFQKPISHFVADFVGMKNLFKVSFKETKAIINDAIEVETGKTLKNSYGYLAIRPEDIVISKEKLTSSMRNNFKGVVKNILNHGFYHELHIEVEKIIFKALVTKNSIIELRLEKGTTVYLSFKAASIHIL